MNRENPNSFTLVFCQLSVKYQRFSYNDKPTIDPPHHVDAYHSLRNSGKTSNLHIFRPSPKNDHGRV